MGSIQEQAKIKAAILRTFKDPNCEVTFSTRTSGYLGDICFCHLKTGEEEKQLAVKVGKTDEESKRLMPIKEACEREVFYYNTIKPTFYQFQKDKNIEDPFQPGPKCYGAYLENETDVIILEDLTYMGYEMNDPTKPLNMDHLRMGMQNFARFHSLSFTLRDQRPELFELFAPNAKHIYITKLDALKETYASNLKIVLDGLKASGRDDLHDKYAKFVENGVESILLKNFEDIPNEKVVNHTDCHNDNMFFKYKDADKNKPSEMIMVDFQICCVHSPVFDLAYFLYAGASKDEIPQFEELLKYYYQELCTFIRQMGSDPEKLYPIKTLWEHWDKYSEFGFVMSTIFMEVLLFRKSIAEAQGGKVENDRKEMLMDKFRHRLENAVDHFFNHKMKF